MVIYFINHHLKPQLSMARGHTNFQAREYDAGALNKAKARA
jgi:hypothetical protein